MGSLTPLDKPTPLLPEPCDRCGFSKLKEEDKRGGVRVNSTPLYSSSNHLADAAFEIVIPGIGSLFFCGHHFRQYESFIASRGYHVREWL